MLSLEAIFGLRLGCRIFAVLMRLGIIPQEICEACDNVWPRTPANSATVPGEP